MRGRHHFRRRTFAPCPSPTPAAERGGPRAWNVTVNVRASGPIMPYRPGNGPGQRRSLKGWGGEKPPATLPGKEGQEPHTSLLRHYVFCSRTTFFKNWFLPSSPITTPPSSLLPPALPPFPQILERLPQARRFLSVDPPPPGGGGQVRGQQGSLSGRLTLPQSCVHTGPASRVAPACQSRAPGAPSGSLAGMVICRVGTG